jgi:hypothetical protein
MYKVYTQEQISSLLFPQQQQHPEDAATTDQGESSVIFLIMLGTKSELFHLGFSHQSSCTALCCLPELHCKKSLSVFPSPAGLSLTKHPC